MSGSVSMQPAVAARARTVSPATAAGGAADAFSAVLSGLAPPAGLAPPEGGGAAWKPDPAVSAHVVEPPAAVPPLAPGVVNAPAVPPKAVPVAVPLAGRLPGPARTDTPDAGKSDAGKSDAGKPDAGKRRSRLAGGENTAETGAKAPAKHRPDGQEQALAPLLVVDPAVPVQAGPSPMPPPVPPPAAGGEPPGRVEAAASFERSGPDPLSRRSAWTDPPDKPEDDGDRAWVNNKSRWHQSSRRVPFSRCRPRSGV